MKKNLQREFFFKNGFYYYKKIISKKKIDIFYKSIIAFLSKYNKDYKYLHQASFKSVNLCNEIQFLKKRDSNLTTFIYTNNNV
jgi:hypothetical protein